MKSCRRISVSLTLLGMLLAACGGAPAPAGSAATAPAGAAGTNVEPTPAPAANGEKVTLSLWIFEGEEAFLPKLKEAFEAKYPNINLEITQVPENQYVTKIDTALAANDPPDIGFVYGGQQRWLKAGKFLPLDDMFSANNITVSNYSANAMSLYCLYEGKNYCIGSYTGAILLLYNKDLFDAAGIKYPSATEPMTVDQYAALASSLTKKSDDINQRVWGGSASNTYWFMDWTTHFSADGKKAVGFINDDATVHTYQVMAQMIKDGTAPSTSDMQQLGDVDVLAQKKQAMTIIDNTVISTLEAQGIRYGAAPAPVEQKGDKPFVISWTDAFGAFSQSKHPKEALEFLAFLGTDGNQLRETVANALPLNLVLATKTNWTGTNEGRKEVLEVIKLARPTIFVPGFYEITAPLNDAFNSIIEGQKQPKEAMDEAATQVQDNLDKAWDTWNKIK